MIPISFSILCKNINISSINISNYINPNTSIETIILLSIQYIQSICPADANRPFIIDFNSEVFMNETLISLYNRKLFRLIITFTFLPQINNDNEYCYSDSTINVLNQIKRPMFNNTYKRFIVDGKNLHYNMLPLLNCFKEHSFMYMRSLTIQNHVFSEHESLLLGSIFSVLYTPLLSDISFSGCPLNPVVNKIFTTFLFLPKLRSLNISYTGLTSNSLFVIAQSISRMSSKCFASIDVSYNPLSSTALLQLLSKFHLTFLVYVKCLSINMNQSEFTEFLKQVEAINPRLRITSDLTNQYTSTPQFVITGSDSLPYVDSDRIPVSYKDAVLQKKYYETPSVFFKDTQTSIKPSTQSMNNQKNLFIKPSNMNNNSNQTVTNSQNCISKNTIHTSNSNLIPTSSLAWNKTNSSSLSSTIRTTLYKVLPPSLTQGSIQIGSFTSPFSNSSSLISKYTQSDTANVAVSQSNLSSQSGCKTQFKPLLGDIHMNIEEYSTSISHDQSIYTDISVSNEDKKQYSKDKEANIHSNESIPDFLLNSVPCLFEFDKTNFVHDRKQFQHSVDSLYVDKHDLESNQDDHSSENSDNQYMETSSKIEDTNIQDPFVSFLGPVEFSMEQEVDSMNHSFVMSDMNPDIYHYYQYQRILYFSGISSSPFDFISSCFQDMSNQYNQSLYKQYTSNDESTKIESQIDSVLAERIKKFKDITLFSLINSIKKNNTYFENYYKNQHVSEIKDLPIPNSSSITNLNESRLTKNTNISNNTMNCTSINNDILKTDSMNIKEEQINDDLSINTDPLYDTITQQSCNINQSETPCINQNTIHSIISENEINEKVNIEEEEELRMQTEEEELLRKQKDEEEELLRKHKEEELRKQEQEELRKHKEEEELRKQKQKEEELRKQKEEQEELLRKQEEEQQQEEKLRKQKEEEKLLGKKKEDGEKLSRRQKNKELQRKKKEEEKLLRKQKNEELQRKKKEEKLLRKQKNEELQRKKKEEKLLKKQKNEELQRKQKEEEEVLLGNKKEEELLRKHNYEELIRKWKQKEELLRKQRDEELLKKKRQEEELFRKQQEEVLLRNKKEEEELKQQEMDTLLIKQRQERNLLRKQVMDQLLRKFKTKELLRKQQQERDLLRNEIEVNIQLLRTQENEESVKRKIGLNIENDSNSSKNENKDQLLDEKAKYIHQSLTDNTDTSIKTKQEIIILLEKKIEIEQQLIYEIINHLNATDIKIKTLNQQGGSRKKLSKTLKSQIQSLKFDMKIQENKLKAMKSALFSYIDEKESCLKEIEDLKNNGISKTNYIFNQSDDIVSYGYNSSCNQLASLWTYKILKSKALEKPCCLTRKLRLKYRHKSSMRDFSYIDYVEDYQFSMYYDD